MTPFSSSYVNVNTLSIKTQHVTKHRYKEYLDADYPRLIVRFEDLQFHAKEMVDLVCQCAGAKAKNNGEFAYIVDSGKWGAGT